MTCSQTCGNQNYTALWASAMNEGEFCADLSNAFVWYGACNETTSNAPGAVVRCCCNQN